MTTSVDTDAPLPINTVPRGKKRKMKYKDLMKDAMNCERADEDLTESHKKKLDNSLGGGSFKKIDKI